ARSRGDQAAATGARHARPSQAARAADVAGTRKGRKRDPRHGEAYVQGARPTADGGGRPVGARASDRSRKSRPRRARCRKLEAGGMSKGLFRAAVVAILALALFFGWRAWQDWQRGYDPETVVAASLQGLQEQNVLVPFTARYVAVVTSTQSRLGLSAKKTLIMPGTVRYELDLGKLKQSDLD